MRRATLPASYAEGLRQLEPTEEGHSRGGGAAVLSRTRNLVVHGRRQHRQRARRHRQKHHDRPVLVIRPFNTETFGSRSSDIHVPADTTSLSASSGIVKRPSTCRRFASSTASASSARSACSTSVPFGSSRKPSR